MRNLITITSYLALLLSPNKEKSYTSDGLFTPFYSSPPFLSTLKPQTHLKIYSWPNNHQVKNFLPTCTTQFQWTKITWRKQTFERSFVFQAWHIENCTLTSIIKHQQKAPNTHYSKHITNTKAHKNAAKLNITSWQWKPQYRPSIFNFQTGKQHRKKGPLHKP